MKCGPCGTRSTSLLPGERRWGSSRRQSKSKVDLEEMRGRDGWNCRCDPSRTAPTSRPLRARQSVPMGNCRGVKRAESEQLSPCPCPSGTPFAWTGPERHRAKQCFFLGSEVVHGPFIHLLSWSCYCCQCVYRFCGEVQLKTADCGNLRYAPLGTLDLSQLRSSEADS